MSNEKQQKISNLTPWVMWGLAASFFFLMYIGRVSPGVIATDLMRDFSVSAFALGSLSAYFFYPYVAMQVPVGILVDRFGTRSLLTLMLLLCAMATYLFGSTSSLEMAKLARFLCGFSASFAFVGSLKLASVWFPARRIGLLAGLTQTLGMLGAALGQRPIAMFVESFGWRATEQGLAIVFFALACLVLLFVRDRPAQGPVHGTGHLVKGSDLLAGFSVVVKNSQTWINGFYAGLLFAPTAAFAELWGNEFLKQTYGLDIKVTTIGIGLIFIGWSVGGPLIGAWSDALGSRRPLMWLSAALSCVLMSIVLYMPDLPLTVLFTALFLFGVCNTGVCIAYAVASEINPNNVSGTSLGVANMLSIIVGAGFQPLTGWLLDFYGSGEIISGLPVYTDGNYRLAMSSLPISLVLAFIAVFFIGETHCQRKAEQGSMIA